MSITTIPDTLLEETSKVVAARLGLHFPPARWVDLERGMAAAASELGHQDAPSFMQWWCAASPTRREIEALAAHLTVGETYFFRDANTLEALQSRVLPDLIQERRGDRRLRIWSAGCATGEEPYSLAMLLDRLIPEPQEWTVTILATDINVGALEKARRGVYGKWSFRGTPPWAKAAYFQERASAGYQLADRVRSRVCFQYLNLAEDAYPSLATNTNAMDVVFCRNVLMYFSPERARRVVDNLHRALVAGGWLIVSPSELSQSLFSDFVCVHCNGAILYRKVAEHQPHAPLSFTFTTEELPPASADKLLAWEPAPTQAPIDTANPPHPPLAPVDAVPEHCYERALALYQAGKYAEARGKLESLLPSDGADGRAAALLARVCANEGKLADALAWCDRALRCDKLQPSYHYLRAVVLEESGQTPEAAGALRRALYLNPDFVLAHFTLSGIAGRRGNARECRGHRRAALSLLQSYNDDEVLPESEGITAGRLAEIIATQEERV